MLWRVVITLKSNCWRTSIFFSVTCEQWFWTNLNSDLTESFRDALNIHVWRVLMLWNTVYYTEQQCHYFIVPLHTFATVDIPTSHSIKPLHSLFFRFSLCNQNSSALMNQGTVIRPLGCPVLSDTGMFVVDPLGLVCCWVGPPWIRNVLARPTDA